MTVNSVAIDGQPATFDFRQPTYPGNPNGPDDPDPLAHAISNVNPVSGSNPFPPACSPQVSGNAQNGQQCPANKLVITPSSPIPSGATFTVTINYTGRPGVHTDGDGSTEGWFRVNTAAAPNDGGFVTTEPVGNMAWMPLNNHPSAKPTIDVYDTVPVGKTAISAGALITSQFDPVQPTSVNPPDANFPGGSWTWHWHSPEPIASYLLTNTIGSYDMRVFTSSDGVQYYQAMASGLTRGQEGSHPGGLRHPAEHHSLPNPIRRALPVHDQRRHRRPSQRRLCGGDADQDHVREWSYLHALGEHVPSRELPPVVWRQRL